MGYLNDGTDSMLDDYTKTRMPRKKKTIIWKILVINFKTKTYKTLATSIRKLFLLILINHWQDHTIIILLMIYVLIETVLYIPTLIFASDLFSRPRSYKRSMLLLFFNYIEIVVAFGVLYTLGNNMNKPFAHWFDSVYFSLVSSNSIGFGDYYPVTTFGKVLVSIQAIFFLSFVILFLNFFSTKVKSKGYFDNEEVE